MGVELSEQRKSPSVGDLGPHVRGVISALAIGVAIGGIGVLVSALLFGVSDDVIYAPQLGAVAIAVWIAGRFGALAAIVTGWALADYAITSPRMSFGFDSRDDFVRWAISLLVGILIGAVGIAMRRGQERAALAAESEEQSRLRVERLQALAASLSAALTVEQVASVMVDGVPTAIGARVAPSASSRTTSSSSSIRVARPVRRCDRVPGCR